MNSSGVKVRKVSFNQEAESYMENDKYLMLSFPFHRQVTISKENCDEEQLRFFRNIVPPEKQQKQEKKAAVTGWILVAVCIIYAGLFFRSPAHDL